LVGGCAVIEAQTIPKSVLQVVSNLCDKKCLTGNYAIKNALPAIGVVSNLCYQHANEFHAWHMESG
jgi:hypothetical protein